MQAGSWLKVADQVPGTGGSIEVLDSFANLDRSGFYRVSTLAEGSTGPPGFASGAEAHGLNTTVLSTSLVSSGANRVLLVGLCWNDASGDSVSGVTYGGVACSHVATTSWFYGNGKLALYALTAPPIGTQTLQVAMTGSVSELALAGMIFTNANQVQALGTASSHFGELPESLTSIVIPSSTQDLVVDLLGYYAFDPTPGAGQSLRLTSDNPGYASMCISTKPGTANSTAMSWSISGTTEISQLGIAIKSR